MTTVTELQSEITHWENDLTELEAECTAEGWTEPEKLLLTMQRTSGTYRHRILPRLETDRSLAQSASEAPRTLATCTTIVRGELVELIDRLDELRLELIRFGQTPQLQVQAVEILAGLRALGKVVLRFGREIEIPAVSAQLTQAQQPEGISSW
jgi:hypothetical protein